MNKKLYYNSGNIHKRICRNGFTLVELSLSLVFIAILSIAVVLVMTSAISSYHRSITLNKVDNVGASLMRDMKDAIRTASASSLKLLCEDNYGSGSNALADCEEDGGKNFASVVRYAKVKIGSIDNASNDSVPVFGAICTGTYSYIWNSGYFFNEYEYTVEDVDSAKLVYKLSSDNNTTTVSGFKLLKVKDEARKVCAVAINNAGGDPGAGSDKSNYNVDRTGEAGSRIGNEFNLASVIPIDERPIQFLGDDSEIGSGTEGGQIEEVKNSGNLAIYNMTTTVSEQRGITKNAYYYNSFILGTVQGGINIDASGNTCATSEGDYRAVENLDYCAINKFNFAALATGG